eukprot:3351314-Rhodomonas_salina.2
MCGVCVAGGDAGSQSPESPPLSVRLEHRVREIRSKYDAVYGYQVRSRLMTDARCSSRSISNDRVDRCLMIDV